MTEIKTLIMELIQELNKMTVEELQRFRPEMMEEMERAGYLPFPVLEKLLNMAFDLVIQMKQEKAVATA